MLSSPPHILPSHFRLEISYHKFPMFFYDSVDFDQKLINFVPASATKPPTRIPIVAVDPTELWRDVPVRAYREHVKSSVYKPYFNEDKNFK